MKVKYFEDGIPFIVIEDVYEPDELDLIWQELDFMCHPDKMLTDPEETGGSREEDGTYLKKNSAIWLDLFFTQRKYSNILTCNRKLFKDNLSLMRDHGSWFFKTMQSNEDYTLLSYYEDGDYYEPHYDWSTVTSLTWFYKDPKSFKGGDLSLHYEGKTLTIPCENNKALLFPSYIMHSVSKIEMDEELKGKKMGRWCMTQFITYQGKKQ